MRIRRDHLSRRCLVTGLVAGCLSLALTGCIFEPREPEPPVLGTTVDYFEAISSVRVWANLERSLEASHAPGWEDSVLPSEFRYIPDSVADGQYPGLFETWNRESEINFINNLYNSGVTITAQLQNDEFVPPQDSGNEVIWENVIYDVTVTSSDNLSVTRIRGSAIITFRLEGNFWYIYQWRDQQGESDPDSGQILSTMGVLRGNFASK